MVDTGPISLSPYQNTQPNGGLISLDAGTAPAVVPNPNVSETKAAKTAYAVGPITGKTQEDYHADFMSGQEPAVRQNTSAIVDQKSMQQRNMNVRQALANPNMTPEDIQKYILHPLSDPKSVIEDEYSKSFLAPVTNLTDPWNFSTPMPKAMIAIPQEVAQVKDETESILGWKEFVHNRTAISQQLYDNQSWFGWGTDQAKGFFQVYNEFKLRGWTGQMDWTSILGDALNHERLDMLRMDPGQRKLAFETAMQKLEKDNPSLAVMFGNAMEDLSLQQIDHINTGAVVGLASDVTMGAPVAKGIYKGLSGFARKSITDAAKAADIVNVGTEKTVQDVKQAAAIGQGNAGEAAVQSVTKDIVAAQEGKLNPEKTATDQMLTYFKWDSDHIRSEPNVGQELKNRIAEQTINSGTNLVNTTANLIRTSMAPVLEADEAVARLAKETAKRQYSGPNSQIFEAMDPYWDPPANRHMVPILIGNHDGEMFKNITQAEYAAEMNGWAIRRGEGGKFVKAKMTQSDITIEQQGNSYYIKATVPVNLTQDGIRDALIKMPGAWSGSASKGVRAGTGTPYLIDPITQKASTKTWDTVMAYLNSGFGKVGYRSPEETLSPVENEQRKIVTFGAHRIMQMFHDNAKIVSSGNSAELKRLLVRAQNMPDPQNITQKGRFFRGISDFKDEFINTNSRLPTDKETEAYFAYKNMYEQERGLRSLAMIRNKSRVGVMEYSIKGLGDDGKTIRQSPYFDAYPVDGNIPRDGNTMYVNVKGREYAIGTNDINAKTYKEFNDKLSSGEHKLLKVWNPTEKPLNEWAGSKINPDSHVLYVLTDQPSFRSLQFQNQIPRRGGGHWIFEYPHYLKQANVQYDPTSDKHYYLGDTTAFPFQLRAMGEKVGEHMNQIREFLKAGDEDAARNYSNKWGVAGLDFDTEIKPWFESKRGPGGELIPARFNLHEPFRMVSADKKLIDIDNSMATRPQYLNKKDKKPNFVDGTRYANPAQQFQVEFTGKRDAWDMHTIEDKGSINNPIWQYRPAKLMDPIDALNRGMAKIANSTHMDEYKYFASEHWLQTFSPWLDTGSSTNPIAEIRNSPFYYLSKGEFKKDTPANVKLLGESNRQKMLDLIGQPAALKNAINDLTSTAMDNLYRSGVKTKYIPYEKLSFETDPLAAVRSLTADVKLGFGSIPAFFMQASAFANIAAINPRSAAGATLGALFHQWARVIPQHLDHLDDIAANKMLNWLPGMNKWMPGQLKEATQLYIKSGFNVVGAEHAAFDSMLTERGVMTPFDMIRYWGRTFFREGAQFVRDGAFYSAYLEHRAMNPTGPLSRADESWILNRASLLDHDMNRAANSAINSGPASFGAQFYNYSRNLAEDMYGKRLTWQEKARLFTLNGVLWGIPAGAVGLYGVPMSDQIRKYTEKYLHYVPGDGVMSSFTMEGGMSALGALITGHGDTQAGTWYDSSKFGVKGYDPINNFSETDKGILDFLGGATFSTWKNTILRSHSFITDMAYLISGQPGRFKVTGQDVVDIFKEMSSVSYGWKLYMALNYHAYLSNNGTTLDDNVTASDAWTRFITGTVPVNISDITTNREIMGHVGSDQSVLARYVPGLASREAFQKDMISRINRNANFALLSAQNNDQDGYETYMTKVQTLLEGSGLNPKQRSKVITDMGKKNKSLVDSIDWQLSTQNVPEDQMAAEADRYLRSETLKRKRLGIE